MNQLRLAIRAATGPCGASIDGVRMNAFSRLSPLQLLRPRMFAKKYPSMRLHRFLFPSIRAFSSLTCFTNHLFYYAQCCNKKAGSSTTEIVAVNSTLNRKRLKYINSSGLSGSPTCDITISRKSTILLRRRESQQGSYDM